MSRFAFADYVLDTDESVLYRGRTPCSLAPKVLDTLLILVQNSGHLVSKDDLMKGVWNDSFVEENNLTQYIFVLRRLFEEHHPGKKFIETLPRRGYRFVPDVIKDRIGDRDANVGAKSAIAGTRSSAVRHRLVLLSAAIVILVFLTGSFLYKTLWRQREWSPEHIKITKLTDNGGLRGAAISPDGNLLAYVVRNGSRYLLNLKNILTDSDISIGASDAEINSPRFSPDGNFVFYSTVDAFGKSQVLRIPIFGGDAVKIAEDIMSEFSVSPDGKMVAFPRRIPSRNVHQIVLAATDGSGERILAERFGDRFYSLWGPAPAWHPDGQSLTVVAGAFDRDLSELVNIELGSGAETPLPVNMSWAYVGSISWAGIDQLLVTAAEAKQSNEQLWKIEMPAGNASRITNDLSSYDSLAACSRSGRIVALQQTDNFHLWLWNVPTGASTELTAGENRHDGTMGVSIVPDGHILFTARDKNELNIYDVSDGGVDPTELTKHAGRNFEPAVSPDGHMTAFVSDRSGQERIWLADRDGSHPRQLITAGDENAPPERTPSFSADGKSVFFLSMAFPKSRVIKASVDGGTAPTVVDDPAGEILPAVSPDGNLLAVGRSVDDTTSKIAILRLADPVGEPRFLDFPAYRMLSAWMPDSGSIVTIDSSNEGNNLVEHDLTSGASTQLTHFSNERIERFAISRDGKIFVLSRGTSAMDAVLFTQ